jgi:hypothetical protein
VPSFSSITNFLNYTNILNLSQGLKIAQIFFIKNWFFIVRLFVVFFLCRRSGFGLNYSKLGHPGGYYRACDDMLVDLSLFVDVFKKNI